MSSISQSQFGLKSKSFIEISEDNRVHLWEIDSGKEKRVYVEKNHLSHSYITSSWYQSKKDQFGLFAVAASSGTVIIWDLSRGVVTQTLNTTNESITELAFSNDGESIFISSKEPEIIQYSIKTGNIINNIKSTKKGAIKLAMNPKANVLAIAR